jgi:hypothetical protein
MKYLCLVYGEEKEIAALTDDECMAYDQVLRNAAGALPRRPFSPFKSLPPSGSATERCSSGTALSPKPRSTWLGIGLMPAT